MPQPRMVMEMSVGLPRRIGGAVRVLVMPVVDMRVCVSRRFMDMLMLMALGQV